MGSGSCVSDSNIKRVTSGEARISTPGDAADSGWDIAGDTIQGSAARASKSNTNAGFLKNKLRKGRGKGFANFSRATTRTT